MSIEQVIADAVAAIPDPAFREIAVAYRADMAEIERERDFRNYGEFRERRDLLAGRADLKLGRALGRIAS